MNYCEFRLKYTTAHCDLLFGEHERLTYYLRTVNFWNCSICKMGKESSLIRIHGK